MFILGVNCRKYKYREKESYFNKDLHYSNSNCNYEEKSNIIHLEIYVRDFSLSSNETVMMKSSLI